MAVSISCRDVATACCRSLVNVAIPQRRGSELPRNARRMEGAMMYLGDDRRAPMDTTRRSRERTKRRAGNSSALARSDARLRLAAKTCIASPIVSRVVEKGIRRHRQRDATGSVFAKSTFAAPVGALIV